MTEYNLKLKVTWKPEDHQIREQVWAWFHDNLGQHGHTWSAYPPSSADPDNLWVCVLNPEHKTLVMLTWC